MLGKKSSGLSTENSLMWVGAGIAAPGLGLGTIFLALFVVEWSYFVVAEGLFNGKTIELRLLPLSEVITLPSSRQGRLMFEAGLGSRPASATWASSLSTRCTGAGRWIR